ncbi:transglycosylase domain-containing protein [Streptomyces sp. C10-9-1]|uniref:transglycosylase domain-containing protein n=1 Tax=Streptomyces sp. C10-9-1 TaxID=1859285 RepID=UPI003D72072E
MSDESQQSWPPRDATAPGPVPPAPDGKRRRTPRRRRTGWRRAVPTWRTVLGTALATAALLTGAFLAGYLLIDIPAANATATAQTNVYLYRDGTRLARDGEVNRENIHLSDVPTGVQRAVLAAEDRDFHSAPGVDPQAMLRAAWNTVTGKGRQSGSTITQQYVKNYYLAQEQTLSRKVREFFIAVKLGREHSKDEILEGYLNTSYFGRGAYGIQAAAHAYYAKDAADLDTAEGAYLASLLNAPSQYDVATHPHNRPAALARWNYVLDGMVDEQWLTPAARRAMRFPAPRAAERSPGLSGQRGYLVEAVTEHLSRTGVLEPRQLAQGGYRITTTLDPRLQDALTEAVDEHVTHRLDDTREADRTVRVGGASLDPATGEVLAMYGGIDYTEQFVNNATRRDYQVGSTFKPFVFASAVENSATTQDGRPITPNTVYDGTSARPVHGWPGTPYAPENEDDVSYGPVTVGRATDESVNAVYAQMAVDVGPADVRSTAVALGLPPATPDLTASPSIALGPATASVLDMAGAYATLAAHGRHLPPALVLDISRNGTGIALPERRPRRAVSREAADTTTAVLRNVVDGGTGAAAGTVGRPAAGKTGTAEEDRAAWFAGYTPDLVTVVALLGQDPETGAQTPLYGALGAARINGGGPPAEIWATYTAAALQDSSPLAFDLTVTEEPRPEQPPAEQDTAPDGTPNTPDAPHTPDTPDTPDGDAPYGDTPGEDAPRTDGTDPAAPAGGAPRPLPATAAPPAPEHPAHPAPPAPPAPTWPAQAPQAPPHPAPTGPQ